MGIFLHSLFFLVTSVSASSLNDPQKLVAVSHSGIADILYRHIRKTIPNGASQENINSVSKKRICHYLTERNFFGYQSRVHMHEIYNELQCSYRNIFDMLHEQSTKSRNDIIYTNPIRSLKVDTSVGTVSEFAFLCPVRGTGRVIRSYFVSMEYDVSDSPSMKIAGRFVFRYHGNGETSIFALAEEPATTLSTPGIMVEGKYLERKKTNVEPVAKESEDPLCMLSDKERLRVCTLVMNAQYFEDELDFVSSYDDAIDNTSCLKREIVFRGDKSELGVTVEEVHEEWTITCRPDPTTVYASYQFEYFVSHAYKPNEVFVYRQTDDDETKVFIENLFGNVRFKIITHSSHGVQAGTSAVLENNKNKRPAEGCNFEEEEIDLSNDSAASEQSAKRQKSSSSRDIH